MKMIVSLLFMADLAMRAESTNTVMDLVVTNSTGDVFRGMTLNRVTPDGLLLQHSSGLVKARWNQLPAWCRETYQVAAGKRAALDADAGVASANLVADTSSRERAAELAGEADAHRRTEAGKLPPKSPRGAKVSARIREDPLTKLVRGKIIGKCQEGLIVASVGGPAVAVLGYDKPLTIFTGHCLLRNSRDQAYGVIGQEISAPAMESGVYLVDGVSFAVKSFTAY